MSETNNTASKQKGPAGGGPMGGGPGMMMGAVGPKAKDFGGSIKKLVGYLGKYKWTIIIVWILAIISTVFMILGPKILGTATDELFTGIMSKIAGTGNVDPAVACRIISRQRALFLPAGLCHVGGEHEGHIPPSLRYQREDPQTSFPVF
jgi:ATP-binding cassette subfamily B protein